MSCFIGSIIIFWENVNMKDCTRSFIELIIRMLSLGSRQILHYYLLSSRRVRWYNDPHHPPISCITVRELLRSRERKRERVPDFRSIISLIEKINDSMITIILRLVSCCKKKKRVLYIKEKWHLQFLNPCHRNENKIACRVQIYFLILNLF